MPSSNPISITRQRRNTCSPVSDRPVASASNWATRSAVLPVPPDANSEDTNSRQNVVPSSQARGGIGSRSSPISTTMGSQPEGGGTVASPPPARASSSRKNSSAPSPATILSRTSST